MAVKRWLVIVQLIQYLNNSGHRFRVGSWTQLIPAAHHTMLSSVHFIQFGSVQFSSTMTMFVRPHIDITNMWNADLTLLLLTPNNG